MNLYVSLILKRKSWSLGFRSYPSQSDTRNDKKQQITRPYSVAHEKMQTH